MAQLSQEVGFNSVLQSVISASTFSVAHTKNKEEWECSLGIFNIIEW